MCVGGRFGFFFNVGVGVTVFVGVRALFWLLMERLCRVGIIMSNDCALIHVRSDV